MKLKTLTQALLLSLLAMACEDDDVTKATEREFVPGDLVVGIKPDVPINEVFDLFNDNELAIDQMSGFFHYSTLANDSLNFVIQELKPKGYLNKRGFNGGSAFISVTEDRITVTEFFFEMDPDSQQDWLVTEDKLNLQALGNDTRNVLIKVPVGTEQYWMGFLLEENSVTWVELNIVGGHSPM